MKRYDDKFREEAVKLSDDIGLAQGAVLPTDFQASVTCSVCRTSYKRPFTFRTVCVCNPYRKIVHFMNCLHSMSSSYVTRSFGRIR